MLRLWVQIDSYARKLLVIAICLLSFSWTPPQAAPALAAAPTETPSVHVVLVTVDGVRWQDVFFGPDRERVPSARREELASVALPNLERLMRDDGAVYGAPGEEDAWFDVSGPSYLSLPGYTQLFSGRSAVSCQDNECPGAHSPTLLDRVGQRYGRHNAVFLSSWAPLQRAAFLDPGNALASSGRQGGHGRDALEDAGFRLLIGRGSDAEPAPGYGDYRPDEYTADLALALFERQRPTLLFVGFGDTDEHAHHDDYLSYFHALAQFDEWLGQMQQAAARLREAGHAVTFFITTDHGRDHSFASHGGNPEAARTWLVAAGDGVKHRGPQTGSHQIADISPTIAQLLDVDLPGATGTPLWNQD